MIGAIVGGLGSNLLSGLFDNFLGGDKDGGGPLGGIGSLFEAFLSGGKSGGLFDCLTKFLDPIGLLGGGQDNALIGGVKSAISLFK